MATIMFDGFLTGLLLQIAIGPVFFFILNLSLQRSIMDGLLAVAAVTLGDYIFIALAVLGVGRLLEKPKINFIMGVISSVVLIIFGILVILSAQQFSQASISERPIESIYISSFLSAFVLTISSPLTIVFWASLFTAKAIEKEYAQKQLILFGVGAGLATCSFLGSSVVLLSSIRASIPQMLVEAGNMAIGSLLIVYGVVRACKSGRSTKSIMSINKD
jgi:threonine/homoserine/homoserine lactone efflux protein